MDLVKLSEISHTISKGTTPTTLGHDFVRSGIPFLRAEDVTNDAVNIRNVAFHISPKTHDLLSRSKLQAGDFLITIAGTLGRVGYVPANAPSLNCNQAVAFARLDFSKVDLKYLFLICQSSDVMKNLLDGKKVGTIGNLNLEQIGNLLIPLPKRDEQKRIAAILGKADQLRRQQREATRQGEHLFQTLLYRAFGGEL
jgi:type I restriction enzyme, S subunit